MHNRVQRNQKVQLIEKGIPIAQFEKQTAVRDITVEFKVRFMDSIPLFSS